MLALVTATLVALAGPAAVSAAASSLPVGIVEAMHSFCDNELTNVASLLDWCTADDEDDICTDWEGVTCNVAGDRVDKIVLSHTGLAGQWPDEFNEKMHDLAELAVFGAQFNGSLSNEFFERQAGTLASLELTSTTLGFDIGDLTRDSREMALSRITIIDTAVSGDLGAADPFNAPDLRTLDIRYSALGGELRDAFLAPLAPTLTRLCLKHNAISGAAPEILCSFASLAKLDLSRNHFNRFPACYGAFNENELAECTLQHNINCDNATGGGVPTFDPEVDYSPCLIDLKPNAKHDVCGECGGTGEACTDCTGELDGSAQIDACGVCDGGNATCTDCEGVVLGPSVYDACGVCGGDSSCVDCAGEPFGDACYDICDVCNGDGTDCVDCLGQLFGTLELDECGVCGGDSTTCVDCAGVPNGASVVDACGVCGGNGQSCVDCAGTPHGTLEYDECGVCGGDSSTCGLGSIKHADDEFSAWTWLALALVALLCSAGACVACYCVAGSDAAGTGPPESRRGRRRRRKNVFI